MYRQTVLTFLALLAFLAMAASSAWAQNPEATLKEINQAVEAGDPEAFERLVDVDGILDQSLNIFLRELKKPEVSEKMPPLLALMFSQAAAQSESGETLRGLLRGEARAFVLNGVGSGAFAGRKPAPTNAQGMLAPLFSGASMGRKAIVNMGKASKSGNGWTMPFTVHDYGNDRDYQITGRFTKGADGNLRLGGIENLPLLLAKIGAESQE